MTVNYTIYKDAITNLRTLMLADAYLAIGGTFGVAEIAKIGKKVIADFPYIDILIRDDENNEEETELGSDRILHNQLIVEVQIFQIGHSDNEILMGTANDTGLYDIAGYMKYFLSSEYTINGTVWDMTWTKTIFQDVLDRENDEILPMARVFAVARYQEEVVLA